MATNYDIPTDEEIKELAVKYWREGSTCSFNFYGICCINPEFENDIINLIKKYQNNGNN